MVNCKSGRWTAGSQGLKFVGASNKNSNSDQKKKKRWKAINNKTEKSILRYIPPTYIIIIYYVYPNPTVDNKLGTLFIYRFSVLFLQSLLKCMYLYINIGTSLVKYSFKKY